MDDEGKIALIKHWVSTTKTTTTSSNRGQNLDIGRLFSDMITIMTMNRVHKS